MTAPGRSGLSILVLAKTPQPGRSKTRLAPRFGFDGAAALAAAALADTLDVVAAAPASRRLLVLDGETIPPVPPGTEIVPQVPGTQGERIAAALAAIAGPALLIGMDTPQITPELLALDLTNWNGAAQAWIGLAEDGGWWALGLTHPARDAGRVLRGVPMSTPHTGAIQRRRLRQAGLTINDLPALRDVDEPDDAEAVAAQAPGTRFAAHLRHLSGRPSGRPDQLPAGILGVFDTLAGLENGTVAGLDTRDALAGLEDGAVAGRRR